MAEQRAKKGGPGRNPGGRPVPPPIETAIKTDEATCNTTPTQPSATSPVNSSHPDNASLDAGDSELAGAGQQFETPMISPSRNFSIALSSRSDTGNANDSASPSGSSHQLPSGQYDWVSPGGRSKRRGSTMERSKHDRPVSSIETRPRTISQSSRPDTSSAGSRSRVPDLTESPTSLSESEPRQGSAANERGDESGSDANRDDKEGPSTPKANE